jgi:probable F420-dependent oxidoreductase
MRGHEWLTPVDKLEAFFNAMEDWRLSFKVEGTPPVYLAAHGPKLLEFARRRADGAFMYLTSGHYLSEARAILGDKQLLMMQPCVVSDNLDEARRMARRVVAVYTDLPNYQRAWKAQGFSEADYVDGPSDGLLDELIALGTLDQVQAKLDQRRQAGVDRMIIIPLNLGPRHEPDWEIVSQLIGEQS